MSPYESPPPRVQTLLREPAPPTSTMVVETDGWSQASQVALAEVAQSLELLERGHDPASVVHVARFRRSMFLLLQDLHSRGTLGAA